ncbi:hypothetical protein M2323_003354 [Rhodoblastus acidophilus]|uniref:hypothetical protein n=1 Tax=Rhodoblastus acidophilus TaxID=1074 RepID=UPI0022246002|nr:hypothetical protein [Rhodoblastus acidophilus]MCW2285503.1 hypothetical protein [Rhodoblastus acidophilus]MCW2334413.1 hypothetical protein [Rhodoblastus acidophilus]
MDQPQTATTNDLALILPLILLALLAVGYALNAVLRDKGLGIFGNGAVMMVGMVGGVLFMNYIQSLG